MNISEYQDAVIRTCVTTNLHETLKLALVGLQDELGEIAGPLKKYLWHGHPLDSSHLHEEVGDVLWYLAMLCNALGLSLEDALADNLTKLQRRYPQGFSPEDSLHRTSEGETERLQQTPDVAVALSVLRVKLWAVTGDALGIPLETPLTSEYVTSLGVQLGHLMRILARRHIYPIDDTQVPSSALPPEQVQTTTQKEV